MEELSYRTYVTDALKLAGERKYPLRRWYEIAHPVRQGDPSAIIEEVLDKVASDGAT
jgi:hypothetical protein